MYMYTCIPSLAVVLPDKDRPHNILMINNKVNLNKRDLELFSVNVSSLQLAPWFL